MGAIDPEVLERGEQIRAKLEREQKEREQRERGQSTPQEPSPGESDSSRSWREYVEEGRRNGNHAAVVIGAVILALLFIFA